MFESELSIAKQTWQSFERDLSRLLAYEGFNNVRLVGQTNDHGADVVATRFGKKWLFQAKHWGKPVGNSVIDETLSATKEYEADIPVIVASSGFDSAAKKRHKQLLDEGIPLQLWDSSLLVQKTKRLRDDVSLVKARPCPLRPYQEHAVKNIVGAFFDENDNKALAVLATGLGKTYVAAESIRRIRAVKSDVRVLVCAHTNDLVYQLERAFWPFLSPSDRTLVFNSNETVSDEQLASADFVFGCVDSVSNYIARGGSISFDILLVDECHHVGTKQYNLVFEELDAGTIGGAFALGLSATPWRADDVDISRYFGEPKVCIDMVQGLREGFLANVDYRMFSDNINWDALSNLNGKSFSPRQINRTLFIEEWDDAVVLRLREAWREQVNPRAIVFCGTIDHAKTMRDKINQLGFCRAEALFSGGGKSGETMSQYERNRLIGDFANGDIATLCVVDIFNEGIDVPDVNIVVFQRVTHSRRIFIQQLGRGLRISPDKDKVIVLDFVSDIRRFAAGIELKDKLEEGSNRISLPNKVVFKREGEDDPAVESFLREWLEDVVAIEESDDDASVLKFPPSRIR